MRVTASKVGLLAACQFFARTEAQWVNTTSAAADRGTRFHRAIARYIDSGEVPSAEVDIATIVQVARVWVDHFGRDKLAAEVAFAWDPVTDTAERIPAIERDYQAGHGRLCGTADVVAISRHTRVGYIADWKTGDGSLAGPQLRALGLMLARAEDLDSVTVEGLEVRADGVRHVCTETLDAFALAAVAGELAEALAAVPTAEPVPGSHCGDLYCPARTTCPVGRAIVAEILPVDRLTRHRWSIEIQGAEHAHWLYDRAKLVESAVRAVKDAVKAYVPPGGLSLPDGSRLVEGTRNMPRFSSERAIAMLRAKGATDEEIESLTYVSAESSGLRLQVPGGARGRRRMEPKSVVKEVA